MKKLICSFTNEAKVINNFLLTIIYAPLYWMARKYKIQIKYWILNF